MKKYGLQLRIPPAHQKQAASKPRPLPLPPAFGGGGADDDGDDVEQEISRQAAKNKALQKIEEQHKKAMEEDPSVFDYDGVYDEMKEKIARPKIQDRTERKSKYIEVLMEKAKQREMQHEIIYDRKLLKERSKDDHLYADKEKFVTAAYKKKLADQAKWREEERLRALREEKEDVTKKSDLSDFYFGLDKNVAFNAPLIESKNPTGQEQAKHGPQEAESKSSYPLVKESMHSSRNREQDVDRTESSHQINSQQAAAITEPDDHAKYSSGKKKNESEQPTATNSTNEQYKRDADALTAARERFLARKRAREQL